MTGGLGMIRKTGMEPWSLYLTCIAYALPPVEDMPHLLEVMALTRLKVSWLLDIIFKSLAC